MWKNKIVIVLLIFLLISSVYASSFTNSVFKQGNDFFNPSSTSGSDGIGGSISDILKESGGVIELIKSIGNLVIIIVVVFLGLKYVYSSIEGKADIKESLPSFIVGVIFFYLASEITTFGQKVGKGLIGSGNSFSAIESNLYATIKTIANTFAIIGIVLLGIKYMITAADSKADVKKQLGPLVIGLILVYSSINAINFFIAIGNGLLKNT